MRIAMDATNSTEALVADGGLAVAFEVIAAGRVVKCTVSCESLQRYFWLQPGADDARVLKIFNDGRHRIVAIAERKALRLAAASIHLEVADFQR
jgi:Protein of unknown function (DUF1488)